MVSSKRALDGDINRGSGDVVWLGVALSDGEVEYERSFVVIYRDETVGRLSKGRK